MEPLQNSGGAQRTVARWLFLLVFSVYALTSSGRVRVTDEFMVVWVQESFVTHGFLTVPQFIPDDQWWGRVDNAGQRRAPYIQGHTVLSAPFYAFGRFVLARFPGVPADDFDLVADFTATESNAFFGAVAVLLAFRLLRKRFGDRIALITSLLIAFATPLWVYSAYLYPEPLNLALLLAVACILFGDGGPVSVPRAAIAGLVTVLAMTVRPTLVLMLIPYGLILLCLHKRAAVRPLLVCGAIVGAAGCLYLLRNQAMFGGPFIFGYPDHMEAGRDPYRFETPPWIGIAGYLFSPAKSLFLYAPLTIVAWWGALRWRHEQRDLAGLALLVPLTFALLYGSYMFEGGYSYGPRYLMPSLVIVSLSLAMVLQHGGRAARLSIAALALAGVVVQALGLSVSFLEAEVHHGYYDERSFTFNPGFPSIVRHAQLAWHYLTNPGPVKLGLGFDRWWIFLSRAGVSSAALFCFALPFIAGALLAVWKLARSLKEQDSVALGA